MATVKFLDQTGLAKVLENLAAGNLTMKGTLNWSATSSGDYAIDTNGKAINTNNGLINVGSGSIHFSSDKRLKENIENIGNLLDKVLKTEIKTFNFIKKPEETCVGVIAQDIQENFKDTPLAKILVKTNEDGMLSVNETKFVYVLWEAFKEYVEKTDKEIESLHEELAKLKEDSLLN